MMFKSIYLALSGNSEAQATANAGFTLATAFDAHIVGSDTVAEAGPFLDQTGIGMMATYYEDLYKTAEKILASKRSIASELFETARQECGIPLKENPETDGASCYWHAHDGHPSVVVRLGRLADIIVAACPGEKSSTADLNALEQGIFDARRPVLMVPEEMSFDCEKPVVVAWDGSTEAARALMNSVPLLAKSEKTTLIQIGELDPGSTEMSDAEAYLNLHDISVEAKHVEQGKEAVAETLLAHCQDIGAGCLVMGAYTHSPWKEFVLGGVTQHMIKHAPLPVLFAH